MRQASVYHLWKLYLIINDTFVCLDIGGFILHFSILFFVARAQRK